MCSSTQGAGLLTLKKLEEAMSEENHTTNPENNDDLSCEKVMGTLIDYVEGDLPIATREMYDRHLENCTECSAFLAGYRGIIDAAKELTPTQETLGVDIQNRLRRSLNQRLGLNLPYIA